MEKRNIKKIKTKRRETFKKGKNVGRMSEANKFRHREIKWWRKQKSRFSGFQKEKKI